MKYLRPFFEAKKQTGHFVDESTIRYILMDLTDSGYKVQINNMANANDVDRKYIIVISKSGGINGEEIKSVIEHLSNYMRTEGYIIVKDKNNSPLRHLTIPDFKSDKKDRMFLEYKFSSLTLLKSKKK